MIVVCVCFFCLVCCRWLLLRMRRVDKCTCPGQLKGQLAIVTGGSRGLGKCLVKELLARGASVYVLARDESRLRELKDSLSLQFPGLVEVYPIDISSIGYVVKFVSFLRNQHLLVDILVNNAGLITADRRESVDGVDLVMATNFLGHFVLTEVLTNLGLMSPSGRIVNITSDMARVMGSVSLQSPHRIPETCNSYHYLNYAYAVSKQALEMYCKALSEKLGKSNIKTFCANPGLLDTDISNNWPDLVQKLLKPLLRRTAMKTPVDGVHVVMHCLLCSDSQSGLCYKGCRAYRDPPYSSQDCRAMYQACRELIGQ